jgi:ferredoxin
VCPAGALQAGRPPALNGEACEGCLACLPACPTGALTADDAVAALLNCAARLEADTLELVCQRHPRPETGLAGAKAAIRVRGCLAGLGAGAYVALFALGVRQVLARTDACAQCGWPALGPQVELRLEEARRLLAPWAAPAALVSAGAPAPEPRPVWEADNPPLSRRDVFRLASRRGQVALARAVTEAGATGERQPSRERQRVVAALGQLSPCPAEASPAEGGLGEGYALVRVSAACTACGACARACPTGALTLARDARPSFALSFASPACMGCGICQPVCAAGAITLERAPAWQAVFGTGERRVLREGGLVRCTHCQAWTAADTRAAQGGGALCPVCADRRRNPFGARPAPAEVRLRR